MTIQLSYQNNSNRDKYGVFSSSVKSLLLAFALLITQLVIGLKQEHGTAIANLAPYENMGSVLAND